MCLSTVKGNYFQNKNNMGTIKEAASKGQPPIMNSTQPQVTSATRDAQISAMCTTNQVTKPHSHHIPQK